MSAESERSPSPPAANAAEAAVRVREETRRFEQALPDLLKTVPGKWVVFRDGAVQSTHASEHAAYAEAVSDSGPSGLS